MKILIDNFGFVKVAAAVPSCQVADTVRNSMETVKLIKKAHENNAQVVVFPELNITGFSCGDLFFSATLQQGALNGLSDILKNTVNIDIISVVGLPIYDGVHLYNCAAVLHKGKIAGIVPKTYIPNYDEFNESRWFFSGESSPFKTITVCGQKAPFDSNIIFSCNHLKFAVEICEDMWTSTPPSSMHALNGANIILNLSALTSVVGKDTYTKAIVKQRSFTSHCGYLLVSAGVCESSTDVLYSGHALIAENGAVLLDKKQYSFESNIFYSEIDLQRIDADRKKRTTFYSVLEHKRTYQTVEINADEIKLEKLTRFVSPFPFLPKEDNAKNSRMDEIYNTSAYALAKRLRHTNIKTPVIGVSGGLDSTLALLITVHAADILKIERSNIIAVTMPGFGTTKKTLDNAKRLMELLGVSAYEIDITKACKQHFNDIGHNINNTDTTFENAQARERTQILMDIANAKGGLVIGTGDLSELALGWTTYGGDHISMYAVNIGIPKTLVFRLVDWIGKNIFDGEIKKIIQNILKTPISPELLPSKEGVIMQKTEEIIGNYDLHDFFLYYFLRFGFTPEKILFLANNAFDKKYDETYIKKCLKIFITRFFANQFKRSCLPDGPKIGSVSLSPRTDWKMPSDAQVKLWLERL